MSLSSPASVPGRATCTFSDSTTDVYIDISRGFTAQGGTRSTLDPAVLLWPGEMGRANSLDGKEWLMRSISI